MAVRSIAARMSDSKVTFTNDDIALNLWRGKDAGELVPRRMDSGNDDSREELAG